MTRAAAGQNNQPVYVGKILAGILAACRESRIIGRAAQELRSPSRFFRLAKKWQALAHDRILVLSRESCLATWFSGVAEKSGCVALLQHRLLPLGSAVGLTALAFNAGLHAFHQAFVPFPLFTCLLAVLAGGMLYGALRWQPSDPVFYRRFPMLVWFLGLTLALGACFGILSLQERYQVIVVLALILWLAGLAWQKPILGLWLFLIFLPLHHLLMTVLSEKIRLAIPALAVLKGWKDALILALFLKSVWQIFIKKAKITWSVFDLLLLAFLALNAVHTVWPQEEAGWQARLQGLRINVYFVLCYYFGRVFTVSRGQLRAVLNGLVILGGAAALTAILEKIFGLGNELVALGFVDYLKHAFNQVFPTPGGLPFTYWIEGKTVWRTGSFFLGPLDMSYALLLIIPATIMRYMSETQEKNNWWLLGALGAQFLAVGLALSRAAMAALFIELAFLAWFQPESRVKFRRALAVAAIVFLGLFAGYQQELHHLLARTAALQEHSTAGHVREWKSGIENIQSQWLGGGLGTKGFVGSRKQKILGGENQYLILGMELGLAGLVLFVSILAGILIQLGKITRFAFSGFQRRFALATAAGMLGLGLVGLTSQVYLNSFVVFLIWWFAGWARNFPGPEGGQHADRD